MNHIGSLHKRLHRDRLSTLENFSETHKQIEMGTQHS